MSDTPRTDAFEDGRIGSPLDLNEYAALAGFARSLERELNEMRADVNGQLLEALKGLLIAAEMHIFGDEAEDARKQARAAIAAAENK